MLSGSRLTVVNTPDDAVILRPRPPGEAIGDIGAAVRDALRFPLAGEPLEALTRPRGRATIVIEPPALPIPTAQNDPRRAAIGAVVDELRRAGVPVENQTLLVAGGLARRLGERDLEQLGIVSPAFARRFRGRVVIHDVEDPGLVEIGQLGRIPLRIHPSLLETDVIVVVTAAETVIHGGPAALLGASGRDTLRAAGAYSLLETSASQGWQLAVAIERELSRRVPVIGASLTLNHPRLGGAARGYPYEQEALDRIAGSAFRRPFGLLPGWTRDRIIRSLRRELSLAAAYGGPPSVAHAEALLRGVETRSAPLEGQLDAIVIGIPRTRSSDPAAVPHLFPGDHALRTRVAGADRGRARRGRGSARDRGLPGAAFLPPAAPLRRLERLRPGRRSPWRGHRRRLPGRRRRAAARLRAVAGDWHRARTGARPRRRPAARRLPPLPAVLPPSCHYGAFTV